MGAGGYRVGSWVNNTWRSPESPCKIKGRGLGPPPPQREGGRRGWERLWAGLWNTCLMCGAWGELGRVLWSVLFLVFLCSKFYLCHSPLLRPLHSSWESAVTSTQGFGARSVFFLDASPPSGQHQEESRKAQFYLDFTTASEMKLPFKCSSLSLSYGLLLV